MAALNSTQSLIHSTANIHYIYQKEIDLFEKVSAIALSQVDAYKFGLVGRLETSVNNKTHYYDIDHLIVPNIGVGLGDCLIEASRYYTIIARLLKSEGYYLATAPRFTYQEEVYELAAQANGGFAKQIPVHTLTFVDLKNTISVTASPDFITRIIEKIVPIYGSLENLYSRSIIDPKLLEPHFYIAESQIALENNFDESFAFRKAVLKLNYITRHYDVGITAKDIIGVRTTQDTKKLAEELLLYRDEYIKRI